MDIRKVKKLIEMLENSNLEEIEIQEGEESVRLVKSTNKTQAIAPQSIVLPQDTVAQEVVDLSVTEKEIKEDFMRVIRLVLLCWFVSPSVLCLCQDSKIYLKNGDVIDSIC